MYRKDLRWCRRRILNQKGYGSRGKFRRPVLEASSGAQLGVQVWEASSGGHLGKGIPFREAKSGSQLGMAYREASSRGQLGRNARVQYVTITITIYVTISVRN